MCFAHVRDEALYERYCAPFLARQTIKEARRAGARTLAAVKEDYCSRARVRPQDVGV